MTPRKARQNQPFCFGFMLTPNTQQSQSATKIGLVEYRVTAIGRGRQNWDQEQTSPCRVMMLFLMICHLKLCDEGKVRLMFFHLAMKQEMKRADKPLMMPVMVGWNLFQLVKMKPRVRNTEPVVMMMTARTSLLIPNRWFD